jgi:hypothetical protein
MPPILKSPVAKTATLPPRGLVALAECIDDFLARASKGRFSPRQVVEEIVRLELVEGAKLSLERRLERSRIGRFKPLADFDWTGPRRSKGT